MKRLLPLFPEKKITDQYTFVVEGTENPSIEIELEWPWLKYEVGEGLMGKTKFVEKINTDSFSLNFRTGKLGNVSVFDLGPFEVVNAHQWLGVQPSQIKNPDTKEVIDEECALWDVASIDNSDGQRITAMRSHAGKDEVFRIATRYNMLLDYARELLDPWRDMLEAGEMVPLDELKASLEQMPPKIKFVSVKTRAEAVKAQDRRAQDRKEAEAAAEEASRPNPRVVLAIIIAIVIAIIAFSGI